MPERMKVYTKTGDRGETALLYGVRLSKADLRVSSYGDVDETASAIGVARAFCTKPRTKEILTRLGRELFVLGAELATPPERYAQSQERGWVATPAMVAALEGLIDELEPQVEMPRQFIAPGTSGPSALLDLARAVTRRAERSAVALRDTGAAMNPALLVYLNRLADLLYMLARFEEDPAQREYI